MTQLFERRVSVIVGEPTADPTESLAPDAIEVTDLRVVFKIKKTLKAEPNTAEIAVYGMSENSRSFCQAKGSRVIVQAGYTGTVAGIFSGDARTIDHTIVPPNVITKIQCGDGERAFKFARVNASFAPGQQIKDALKAAAVKVAKGGNFTEAVNGVVADKFTSGFSFRGRAADMLDRLLGPYGLTWSVQDGQLQILKAGAANKDTIISLDADSGLIGSPEHGTPNKKGLPSVVKVKCLLRPELRPGSRVQVSSRSTNGVLTVQQVEHSGDTAGSEWYSDLECLPTSLVTV